MDSVPSSGEEGAWGPRRADAAVISVLLLLGALIGLPFFTDGYATYLDNPVHLAEVDALAATETGWTDISFCGFPVHSLHSPLWYGTIARLAAWGLPSGLSYRVFVWLAFCWPAIAIYWVGRRRAGPLLAGGLALLLVLQRPTVMGIASAFGGMWTFFIAAGCFVFLLDVLASGRVGRGRAARIALWTGVIGLTHLFWLYAVACVAAIHLVASALSRPRRRLIPADALAAGLGALASAAYWLVAFMGMEGLSLDTHNAPGWAIWTHLILPVDLLAAFNSGGSLSSMSLDWPAGVPMWLLLGLGLAGVFMGWRARDRRVLYAAALVGVLLVALTIMLPGTDRGWLGNVSWRMVYVVRLALAIAAVGLLGALSSGRAPGLKTHIVLAAAGLAAGLALAWQLGTSLADETPSRDSDEVGAVEEMWAWIAEHRDDTWRRIYQQDTFSNRPTHSELAQSHVLARTTDRTGAGQLGAYYGVAPYRSSVWGASELGRLFGHDIDGAEDVSMTAGRMHPAGCSHILLVDGETAELFAAHPAFELVHRVDWLVLFRLVDRPVVWSEPLTPGIEVQTQRQAPGRISLSVRNQVDDGTIVTKESAHPFWAVTAPDGVGSETLLPPGFMQLEGLPVGEYTIDLEYRPPAFPFWLSVVGWLTIGLTMMGRRRETSP